MYPNIHSSMIYNSQDMETTQVPINRWTDKEDVIYLYSEIWLHHGKWNIALCSNMEEPREYHTKWSKSKKDKYGITYMWNLKNITNESIYKTETDSQT